MPLTLLYQEKLVSTKNLIFSFHEEWEAYGQSFVWQTITKLLEHISSKVWKNCRGLESGPERDGIGSVIELAMAKQVHKKVDHFTTWLVGVMQKFDSFKMDASLKKSLVYLFLVTRFICSCCLWGFVVPLFCSLMPNVKVLSFWSEIIKRFLVETHVFGTTFIFCIFLHNGGAPDLLRHLVDLSVSLTMPRPVEAT